MNVEQILFVLTIVIIFIALILIPFFIYKNLYKKGYKKDDKEDIIFPESSPESSLISDWKWNDKCRGNVKFMEKSQWPTFLDKNAWDDGCQGCKSVPNTSTKFNDQQQNNSRDSFQVIGDWMRIGQRNSGSFSNLSTAKSKNHWFNPPRNNTDDKPLEIEWYMYLDASSWGKTQKDIAKSGITKANWSAFWTFGHGMQLDPKNKDTNYGWPYCGEWDLAESLPVFSNSNNITDTTKKPNGFATGFHNGASGAYPPCCLKRDGIMYEKPNSQNSNSIFAIPAVTGKYGEALKNIKNTKDKDKYLVDNNSDLYYYAGQGDSNGSTFLTWGKALFKKKYGVFPKPKGTPQSPSYEEFEEAASLAYNTTIHCYLRCTTDSVIMYIKTNVDPSNPPKTNITSSMSQDEVKDIMEDNGYVTVFSSYGDFGSNADSTFSDQFNIYMGQAGMKDVDKIKPTNWHQNMMFVWSVITQMNNSGRFTNTTKDNDQLYFWKHLMSYMSDISIRGGGNYTKAMAPPGITDPNLVKLITQGYDATSYEQYNIKKLANFDNTKDVAVLDCRNILTRI